MISTTSDSATCGAWYIFSMASEVRSDEDSKRCLYRSMVVL